MQLFPAITVQEFAAACESLEARCADGLHATDWLSIRWTGEELLIKQKREQARDRKDNLIEEGDNVDEDVAGITLAEVVSVSIHWY
jgi:hypothetical protein